MLGITELGSTDVVVIAVYFVVVISVGLWFARKVRDSDSFFLAGRKLTWPLIGLSLFATNISTEHLVGLAQAGYSDGLVWGGYEWIASYCLIMLAVVFAPQYVRHKVYTIPEYFEKRFGVETRVALTVYFLAMIVLTKVSVAVYSGSAVVHSLTGWNEYSVMWTIGIITALYTLFGGLAAVVYTDAIQSLVLIGGSLVMTVLALGQVGGWEALTEKLAEAGKSEHLSMVRGPSDPTLPFTGFLLGNFLLGGMFYWCMDQVNVQRVLGARDVQQARLGAVFGGFLKIIPVFILVLPGVIAAVLYENEIGAESEATYAVLVTQLLGPGLRGLVLAALFAALMSSMSSTFNSAATIVSRDLFARVKPDMETRKQVRIGQIALLIVMVIGISIAPLVGKEKTIWKYLQEVTAYLSVPFAVVGLAGVFTRWANRPGALAGVVVGILASAFFFAESSLGLNWITTPYLASFLHRSFVAAVFAGIALVMVSKVTAEPPPEVAAGTFSVAWTPRPEEPYPRSLLGDYRLWVILLFVIVTALWIVFR